MPADRATKVFVSYSRKDRAFVGKLVEALEAADDIEVFRDTDDILPTEEWRERLEQLIGQADAIVFALSPHSAASEVCSWEVEHAESLNKRIAPIVIRDVESADIPAALSKLNYIFFTNRKEFDRSIENLITALNTDIDWIREHTRLGELARRWHGRDRTRSQILRGADLTAAENWLAGQPANAPSPAAHHHEFIQASRVAATRRQRATVGGSLVAAIVAIALAGYALIQQQTAEENARIATRERDRAVAAEKLAEDRAVAEQAAREDAEAALRAATNTANGLIFNLAQEFRDSGVPSATIARILEEARQLQDTLIGDNPDDPGLLQSKAVALGEIARTLFTKGDTDAALSSASKGLAIFRTLVERDPESAQRQNDLSVSLNSVGDIQVSTGDRAAALAAFEEGLAIDRRLVKRDPANTQWQRSLAVNLSRVGDVRIAAGDRTGALAVFEEGLAIVRALVKRNPDNAQWQRDLSVSLGRVGDTRAATGDRAGALTLFEEGLAIRRTLVKRDPENTQWRNDLSVSLNSVGDARVETGDHAGALAAFEEGLAIVRGLVKSDPENTQWRRDLSLSLERVGDIRIATGSGAAALTAFEEGLAIRRALVKHDPENTQWRRDLTVSLDRVGDVRLATGTMRGHLPLSKKASPLPAGL